MYQLRAAAYLISLLGFLGLGEPGGSARAETSWTGFYLGGTVGRQFLDTDWETTCLQIGFPGSECPDAGGVFATQIATKNPFQFEDSSTRFGGYLGAQKEFQSFVVGLEADLAKTNNQAVTLGIPGAELPGGPDLGPDTAEVRALWDGSLRGRVGYLLTSQLMVFATGGMAWMRVETGVHCAATFPDGWCAVGNVGNSSRDRETLRGVTWGAGLEALLDQHWMIRAEYRHSDFEDMESTYFSGVFNNVDSLVATTEAEIDTISIGIAYKF